jgi:hypothetical protein
MAYYPVHQAAIHGEALGTCVEPCATRTRYPVHRPRKSGGEDAGTGKAGRHLRSKALIQLWGQLPTIPDSLLYSGKVNMHPNSGQATR